MVGVVLFLTLVQFNRTCSFGHFRVFAACAPLCHHDRRWCCGLNFGKDLGGCSSCSCCSCVLAGQSDGAMALDKWNGDVGGVVESERNGSAVMCRGCADLLVRWLYSLWSWQHTCMQWPSCLQLGPICPSSKWMKAGSFWMCFGWLNIFLRFDY